MILVFNLIFVHFLGLLEAYFNNCITVTLEQKCVNVLDIISMQGVKSEQLLSLQVKDFVGMIVLKHLICHFRT